MTLKTKLITSVSMFFLVVALLMVGVWAVSTAQVDLGGTISFNATNIYATITGTIEGATNAKALTPLEYSAKTEPDATAKATWCQDLTFADATIPSIKWTVTIENKSERALYVTLTDNITSLSNATKTLTFDGSTYTGGEQTIPAKTSKVFTMEIKVSDTNASATVDYDFDFILRDASTDTPSYLSFEYDDTTMTATFPFGGVTDTTITEAYIPAKVTYNNQEYDVVIQAGHALLGSAFSLCPSLERVVIGDGITTIPLLAFAGCSALSSVVIPNSVTTIGDKAFAKCTSLADVYIPNSVTSIGNSAFSDCTILSTVNVKAISVPTGGSSMFYNCSSSLVIYVPTNSLSDYQTATYWSDYTFASKNF